MTEWTPVQEQELRNLWDNDGYSATRIARIIGRSRGAVLGKSIRLNLHFRRGRAISLQDDHRAVVDAHTLFRNRVTEEYKMVLKPGAYQRKVGNMVMKGRWKGFPIYALTLEERATCPRSCAVFNSCYGNGMHQAVRFKHGPELESALHFELKHLQHEHPKGFVVRLHILGDFYSTEYVEFWKNALKKFPALHIFGYTAWQSDTPIGAAVAALRDKYWMRFSVRTSGAKTGPLTKVISALSDRGDAIVCPAQLNQTMSCSTCALCWGTKKPIAFLEH